jgi:hypothetical protein
LGFFEPFLTAILWHRHSQKSALENNGIEGNILLQFKKSGYGSLQLPGTEKKRSPNKTSTLASGLLTAMGQ